MELCGYKPIMTLEGAFSLLYIEICFGHEEVLGFGPFTQRWYFFASDWHKGQLGHQGDPIQIRKPQVFCVQFCWINIWPL